MCDEKGDPSSNSLPTNEVLKLLNIVEEIRQKGEKFKEQEQEKEKETK